MKTSCLSTLFVALFVFTPPALADSTGPLGFGQAALTRPLETDRPDFTEGTQTVEPGHLQLEAGYTFTYDDENGVETEQHTLPEVLLRVGLLSDLELRLAWDGYARTEVETLGTTEQTEGGSDLNVGMKHHLYEQGDFPVHLSIILALELPTGAKATTSDDVIPEFGILWAYDVSEDFAIAGNINFAAPVDDEKNRFFETSASLTLATGLTESIGGYIEYFGFYPNDDTAEVSTHFLSSGFTYGVTENLQFDIRAGFGLNDDAEDFFTGIGLAVRI